jgi:hypothetical protein
MSVDAEDHMHTGIPVTFRVSTPDFTVTSGFIRDVTFGSPSYNASCALKNALNYSVPALNLNSGAEKSNSDCKLVSKYEEKLAGGRRLIRLNGVGQNQKCNKDGSFQLQEYPMMLSLPLDPLIKQNRTFQPANTGIVGVMRTGYFVTNNMTLMG